MDERTGTSSSTSLQVLNNPKGVIGIKKTHQGPPIIVRGQSKLKVQFSMVNYDFSMHESMSGDSSSIDEHNHGNEADNHTEDGRDEVEEKDVEEDEEERAFNNQSTNEHAAMMNNESGNAAPVNMAQFYYDSVEPSEAKPGHVSNNNQSRNSNAAPAPPAQGKLRRPIPQRKRGVDLSSSSEEYEDPPSQTYDPAKENRKAAQAKKAGTTSNVDGGMLVDDSLYDEMEAKEEQAEERRNSQPDKYENQFMRIPLPASELKDVSSVEQDVDHDKPKLGRRQSFVKGLQRAMSGVKLGSEGERARPAQQPAGHPTGVAGMQRTSSRRGGLHRKVAGTSTSTLIAPGVGGNSQVIERTRDNKVGGNEEVGKRQAIGNMGRMISMNRQKAAAGASGVGGPSGAVVAAASASVSQNQTGPTSNSSMSQISLSHESLSNIRHQKDERNNLAPPSSQSSMAGAGDRPRNSGRMAGHGLGGSGVGRASVGQIGRIMSRGRRKSAMFVGESTNSQPKQPERTGGRASLSRIGRALSFNRGKVNFQQETQQDTNQKPQEGKDTKQTSPLSTSTVSTTSVGSSPLADRERDRSTAAGTGVMRRAPRSSLRGIGRMFSLTRRSAGGGGETAGALERKKTAPTGPRHSRQLLGGTSARKSLGNLKKQGTMNGSGSRATAGGTAPGVGGSGKVDGRADKFVYSEVTSTVIAESGLLGNGKHIRVAQVAMAEYSSPLNRENWYVDVFTLSHNAIRRECMDLYDMLSALARCDASTKDICEDDMNALERWWSVAQSLFRCYFGTERRILFPWVDSAAAEAQNWEVQLALKKMRSLQDKLETLLRKVDGVWNEKTFKSVGEMYTMIYKAIDDFVPRLLNYFADQELLLPAIVWEYYKKENAFDIDKQIIASFMYYDGESSASGPGPRHNLVSLVRWIPKSKQVRAWLGKYLTSSERAMYPTWFQLYDEAHASIVTHLRGRVSSV